MAPTTMASSAKAPKRVGKENAPPGTSKSRTTAHADEVDLEEDDGYGGKDSPVADGLEMSVEETQIKAKSNGTGTGSGSGSASGAKGAKLLKPRSRHEDAGELEQAASGGSGNGDVKRKLATVTADRDRLRAQRDTYAKQFEELSRLRNTETEGLFESYKEKSEVQTKAQNDIIASLTALNEKMKSRISILEKSSSSKSGSGEAGLPPAGGVFESASSSAPTSAKEAKEVKVLKDELVRLRDIAKLKDDKIAQLEKEYKMEVENSRKLQSLSSSRLGASQGPSSSSAAAVAAATSTRSPEEIEKDDASLRIYEDLTELQIVNVKVKHGKAGKEVTLNCLHTNKAAARTIQFKLRTYHERTDDPARPWSPKVAYQPENLDLEKDRDFVERLGTFNTQFTIEREQLSAMWDELKEKMASDEELD